MRGGMGLYNFGKLHTKHKNVWYDVQSTEVFPCKIVYISSKETYAMSLFRVRPLDFLIKPLTKEKVAATLEQFIRLSEANKNEFYYHAGKSVCRLYLDEIHYFACNGRKVEVYTSSGQKEFYGAMREVWEQVEGKGFWIIHKSISAKPARKCNTNLFS